MQKRITKINEMKDRIDRLALDVKVAMSNKPLQSTASGFQSGINADTGDNEALL